MKFWPIKGQKQDHDSFFKRSSKGPKCVTRRVEKGTGVGLKYKVIWKWKIFKCKRKTVTYYAEEMDDVWGSTFLRGCTKFTGPFTWYRDGRIFFEEKRDREKSRGGPFFRVKIPKVSFGNFLHLPLGTNTLWALITPALTPPVGVIFARTQKSGVNFKISISSKWHEISYLTMFLHTIALHKYQRWKSPPQIQKSSKLIKF